MSNLKAIHEATRLQPINKLMVVGHPLSGYASVEQVLDRSGLQAAAASKSQGLSPTQVSDMLLRAYRVQPLNELQTLDNFKPIAPSPVWQTLALDLLLGNLEQELWGWADPQAIYLLDYWKNLDHQLAFVLVYDSPQASLASLFDNPEVDCTEHVVKAASDNWLAYNEALLNFYLGNTERCLLVHGQQVRAKTADCLRQVQHQMGVELKMPFDDLAAELKQTGWNTLQVELCARVISANPKVGQMYTDLQSVASLPMGNAMDKPSFDTDMAVLSKFVALHRSNLKIQQVVEELKAAKEAQAQALNQRLAELVQSYEHSQAHGHALAQEKQHLLALAEDRLRNIDELKAAKEAQAQALNQRLAELVQSYEHSQAHGHALEQEKQHLLVLAEDRLRNIEELRQRDGELQGRVGELAGQLQQAKDEVNQHAAVAAADYVTSNKALEEENQLLLEELFKLQEELENNYLEKNLPHKSKEKKTNQITKTQIYESALQVKEDLPYKLGAAVIGCKRSLFSYISLPFELKKISKEFSKKNKKDINTQNKNEQAEIERVKNHLSYKFGETLIQTGINPIRILMLPYRFNKIYNEWKKLKK